MPRLFFIISFIACCPSLLNSQSNWFVQPSGVSNNLQSISFKDQNTGWALGDGGIIIYTGDGGMNWNASPPVTNNNLFAAASPENSSFIYAVGENGVIIKSTNYGVFWTLLNSGTSVRLNSIFFTDQAGYVAGDNGVFLKTTNEGNTWVQKYTGTINNLNSVVVSNTALMCGDNGTILFSSNYGESWIPHNSGTQADLNSIYGGWIVGSSGVILYRSYSGNWIQQNSYTTNNLNCVTSASRWIYAVGDNGTILRYLPHIQNSTWTRQNSGTSINLNSIHFRNILYSSEIYGWAAGDKVLFLRIRPRDGGFQQNS
ncbi:MAG: YCF48-related protein [Chlorobi bacterium]|nr:YCF48-related protein [Chlorobiota bacterium]